MALLLNAGDTVSRSYSYTQPSPLHPSQPQGTGERTGNLAPPAWAEDFVQRINNSAQAYINNDILRIYASAGYGEYDIKYIFKAEWKENTRYTFNLTYRRDSIYTNASMLQITYTDGTATQFPRTINDGEWHTIYMTSEANKTIKYLNVWYSSMWLEIKIDSFFVYEGTVRKPYEPYGYKIPISSANTTAPVYLGEVESTRKIKKLVLTGQEGWRRTSNGAYYLGTGICPNDYKKTLDESIVMCTHYIGQISTTGSAAVQDNNVSFYGGSSATYEMYIGARSISTLTEFTTYLQQQYAAGTPVTIWYVLATEETAVVNEPLMKIGDYADEVSNISIPVTAGGDTISVGTTVQPSEVTANYHGWHNGAVKGYENGDWQPQVQALSLSNAPMLSNSLMAFPDMSEPEIEPETTE